MILIVLPDIPAEDELLAQARRGSRHAIRQIYQSYYPPVYQFIRLRVDDAQGAEDIASEVFVRFVEVIGGRSAPKHSLRGWLFRVARNELYRHYGNTQRIQETVFEEWMPASGDEDPELKFIRSMDVERARQAIRMLVDDQQEVLILRFGQALSLKATADIMDRSVGAVKLLQFRAVSTLRKILGELRMDEA